MTADEFLERTADQEVRTLASLVFSRTGRGDGAVRKAGLLLDLKKAMQADVVHFRYVKADGSMRSAYGTRDADLIREHRGDPSGKGGDRPLMTFVYFDLVRDDWRAFRPESIVGIDGGYTI
jgi:hypothetical protein